jgi:hypothetical protein
MLIFPMLVAGMATASAQEKPGKSPVSSGTIHSSPETPDRPPYVGEDGRPSSTNPSTVDLPHQPSVGGRDPMGGDPTRPGNQGSESGRR